SQQFTVLVGVLYAPATSPLRQRPRGQDCSALGWPRAIRESLVTSSDGSISISATPSSTPSEFSLSSQYLGSNCGYQLYLDIGREPGTWMDPRWGASGRRVELTLDMVVEDTLYTRRIKQTLLPLLKFQLLLDKNRSQVNRLCLRSMSCTQLPMRVFFMEIQ
ncbi:hypothetical protein ACHAW5_002838, partial [Stephanodiscus triporus]